MARRSNLDLFSAVEREELEADIRRGLLSWRELQRKYKVPQATLRLYAERQGIPRNPSGIKGEIVKALLSTPEPATLNEPSAQLDAQCADSPPSVHDALLAAAQEDARDMRLGLQSARMALTAVGRKLQAALQLPPAQIDARELKVLSECVAINVNTIRLIRGLDAVITPEQIRGMSDSELEAIASGKK